MVHGSSVRQLEPKHAVDLPPEDALLADEAVRLSQRPGDRVVLAREAADEEVDIGDRREGRLATDGGDLGLVLVEDGGDVLVDGDVSRQAQDRPRCGAIPRTPRPYVWKSPLRTWRT